MGAVSSTRVEFETYDAALEYLFGLTNFERVRPTQASHEFKLTRTQAILEALGEPHRTFRSIHVAGSKGKGSVCEMTAATLIGGGLTVGLYTSPHLIDIRERFRINHTPIDAETLRHLTERVARVCKALEKEHGPPTYFEVVTAVAFLYFQEQAVDIAVIETGLGGRLDCTNVIRPEVSIITALQLEHTALLGTTLDQIAREKAGIIKQGVPVVTCPQAPEAMAVLQETATRCGSTLHVVGETLEFNYSFQHSAHHGRRYQVVLNTTGKAYDHIPVPLDGEHQAWNCGMVLATLNVLAQKGLSIPDDRLIDGLMSTPRHGRLERVCDSPPIYVDGAHNPESIEATVRALGTHASADTLVAIFGCASDKDAGGMLKNLGLGADKIILTRSAHNPRASDPKDLAKKLQELGGRSAQIAPTVREALALATKAITKNDVILVTGSFYVAGEAKQIVLEQRAKAEAERRPPENPNIIAETKPGATNPSERPPKRTA